MRCLVVTGTDTGIGKTITTAAICTSVAVRGMSVAVVKPVQTGTANDELDDVSVVRLLTGQPRVSDLVRLAEPLAPESAARRGGLDLPTVNGLAAQISKDAVGAEVVLIEGAGGIAVRLDLDGGTLIGVGLGLTDRGHDVSYVVVTSLRLGTLNHTELTVGAIRQAGLHVAGLVVGSVGPTLELAESSNLVDLPRLTRSPLLGAIPSGAGSMTPDTFQAQAPTWLDVTLLLPSSR